MINETLFDKYMDPLEASFSKSLSKKNRLEWVKEVEECEAEPFCLAMRTLKRGDKFPTFGAFWVQYKINAHEMFGQGQVEPGCDYCVDGNLFVVARAVPGKTHGSKMVWTLLHRDTMVNPVTDCDTVLKCKRCYPNAKRAGDPFKPWHWSEGMNPEKHRHKKMIQPTIAKAMIQELVDKITKKSIDWKAETETAWALHEKAELETNNDH